MYFIFKSFLFTPVFMKYFQHLSFLTARDKSSRCLGWPNCNPIPLTYSLNIINVVKENQHVAGWLMDVFLLELLNCK